MHSSYRRQQVVVSFSLIYLFRVYLFTIILFFFCSSCEGNPLTKCNILVCSMGGLVVKQMLYKAKTENIDNLVKNTVGVVCYIQIFVLLALFSILVPSIFLSVISG